MQMAPIVAQEQLEKRLAKLVGGVALIKAHQRGHFSYED